MADAERKAIKAKKPTGTSFTISIVLIPTGETIRMKNVTQETTIYKIQHHIKYVTGIPTSIMRLFCHDKGDLLGETDARYNDIIQGSQLQCDVWDIWRPLVVAARKGEYQKYILKKLGVMEGTQYPCAAFDYMTQDEQTSWLANRASVVLFIATLRRDVKLCSSLLDIGANVDGQDEDQKTPLILATSKGCLPLVDLFLSRGAKVDIEDSAGTTATMLAVERGYKQIEKRLFIYQWQYMWPRCAQSSTT